MDAEQVATFTRFLQTLQRKMEAVRGKDVAPKDIQQIAKSLMEFFSPASDRKEFAMRRLQVCLQMI